MAFEMQNVINWFLEWTKTKYVYSGIWTCDFRVDVLVLYQLSYLALRWQSSYIVIIFVQGAWVRSHWSKAGYIARDHAPCYDTTLELVHIWIIWICDLHWSAFIVKKQELLCWIYKQFFGVFSTTKREHLLWWNWLIWWNISWKPEGWNKLTLPNNNVVLSL